VFERTDRERRRKKKYSYYDDEDVLATSDRALFPSRVAPHRAVQAIVVRGRNVEKKR
jgi:hypothetical protein